MWGNLFFGGSKREVWRNVNGTIACPGDVCPQDCDNRCPIYVATLGFEALQSGRYEAALRHYLKSLEIAPDFDESWNNVGTCYGYLGNYPEAKKAFEKAHSMAPEKKKPLVGLALVNRDLGNYRDALRYCNLYDSVYKDGALNELRMQLNARIGPARDNARPNPTAAAQAHPGSVRNNVQPDPASSGQSELGEVMKALLAYGEKEGYLEKGSVFSYVPELMAGARGIVTQVWTGIWNGMKESGIHEFERMLSTCLRFCACAGMGAVMHWHRDWPSLNRKGIYETLVQPRGLDEMDEYVTDFIGIKWGSETSERMVRHLNGLFEPMMVFFPKNIADLPDKTAAMTEFFLGAYYYGMTLQMHRLGMR